MPTKRIGPDRVVAAFRKTGLRPHRGTLPPDGPLACGLAAVCLSFLTNDSFRQKQGVTRYMAGILKIEPSYAVGFAFGWNDGWQGAEPDTNPSDDDAWSQRLLGWWDGAIAAEECFRVFGAAQ